MKIYCYVNRHFGEIIAASEDRSLIEEMMMDDFIECYNSEMQDAADEHYINVEDPSEECKIFAKETWHSILNWCIEVYELQEVETI